MQIDLLDAPGQHASSARGLLNEVKGHSILITPELPKMPEPDLHGLFVRGAGRAVGLCARRLWAPQRESELPEFLPALGAGVVRDAAHRSRPRRSSLGVAERDVPQDPYPVHFAHLLRLGDERRGEEAAAQRGDERSSGHHNVSAPAA